MSDQIRIKTGSQPKEVISQATGIQITDIEAKPAPLSFSQPPI